MKKHMEIFELRRPAFKLWFRVVGSWDAESLCTHLSRGGERRTAKHGFALIIDASAICCTSYEAKRPRVCCTNFQVGVLLSMPSVMKS